MNSAKKISIFPRKFNHIHVSRDKHIWLWSLKMHKILQFSYLKKWKILINLKNNNKNKIAHWNVRIAWQWNTQFLEFSFVFLWINNLLFRLHIFSESTCCITMFMEIVFSTTNEYVDIQWNWLNDISLMPLCTETKLPISPIRSVTTMVLQQNYQWMKWIKGRF